MGKEHQGRAPLGQGARWIGLTAAALAIASCNLLPSRRTKSSGVAATPPPPQPVYIEQRAVSGGFMAPLRPPPPARPAVNGPTILSATLGTAHTQGLWGGLPGGAQFTSVPWPLWSIAGNAIAASAIAPFAMAAPPPNAKRSAPRGGCGYVNVGGEQIPVDCFTPGYGVIPSAARPLLPSALFRLSPAHTGAAALPVSVDHREDSTEGPVRHQGRVGACSAFSFATAVDHALARRTGRPGHVSVMHIWARYHEPSMSLPAEKNRDRPLTSEQAWPYTTTNQHMACTWAAKKRCKPSCGGADTCACSYDESSCGREVDAEYLAMTDAYPVARVTTVTEVELDKLALMSALAKGQDIWMSMRFTYDAFDSDALYPSYDGLPFVLPHFEPADATSAHAMAIAGYRVQPKGTYFLLHNSWGERWGDQGYAWVHEQTLMRNLDAAYTVEAEPWDPSWSRVPPRQEKPSQCGDGLLPDSITGQCAPPCLDGSARHNAACPNLADCPAGYVNLYGECVVAAPTAQGTDPATGIRYACAAGGCSFVLPYGVYSCGLPWCAVSCPSPRFRLASGPAGMMCTE